tara:strand:+ start:1084 stop:4785 length:3702 start_codon:yes stop_codon:yes gene_type:complete
MAAKVDLSGIFDNALPMAYIRKVTLSEGPAVSNRKDPSEALLETKVTKNIYGKTKLKEKKNKKIGYEAATALNVTVDLALKDAIGKNGRPIWFNDDEFLKYLSLRVVLCKDRDTGARFLKTGIRDSALKSLKVSGKVKEEVISLRKPSASELIDYRREKIDGKTVYSISYSVNFVIDELNPTHLSIFATTILDTGYLAATRQAYARQIKSKTQGYTTAEVVIDRNSVKNNSYIYTTPENKIWAGPMHHHEEKGYMVGASHSTRSTQAPLKQQIIPNFVVDDFRLLDEIKKVKLQLIPDTLENQQTKRRGKSNKTPEANKIRKKEKYMSSLLIARSPSNSSNFMFHIDFEKIIRFETQFGKLLEVTDSQAKLNILSKSRIKNLRILRHRVRPAAGKMKVKDADWPTRTEVIVFASEETAGSLPLTTRRAYPDNENVHSDPKLVGAIKEVNVAGTKSLRSFIVSDYDMSRKTDGLYQYSIDFQLEDGTLGFVKESLSRLVLARKEIEQHYSDTLVPTNYDISNDGFNSAHKLRLEKKYPLPRKEELKNTVRTNRWRILEHSVSQAPWIRPIATYVDCLFNLTNLTEDKAEFLSSMLYGLCNPTTGNASGILIVIEQLKDLEYKIKSSLGKKGRLLGEFDFVGKGKISQISKDNNMVILSNRFNEIFDSDVLKRTGYDFLGGERSRFVGLRHMTIENYRERIRQENNKYFSNMVGTVENFGVTANFEPNRISYLTPAIIDLGQSESHHLDPASRRLWFYKRYERIVSTILSMKPSVVAKGKDSLVAIKAPHTNLDLEDESEMTAEENVVNTLNSRVLMAFSTTIDVPENYEFKLTLENEEEEAEEENSKFIEVGQIIGSSTNLSSDTIEDTDFVADQLIKTEAEEMEDFTEFTSSLIGGFIKSRKELFGRKKKSSGEALGVTAFNLQSSKNILDSYIERRKRVILRVKKKGRGRKKRDELLTKEALLNDMPNQVKSLFFSNKAFIKYPLTSLGSADPIADPRYEGMIYYNMKMINRIEVFAGARKSKSTGEFLIGDLVYKKLTQDTLTDAVQKNLTLLCRMKPYENKIIGFERNKKLELPTYDEYFVLSPKSSESSVAEEDEQIEAFSGIEGGDYSDLMTIQGDMNNIGYDSLKTILNTAIVERFIEPEYTCTAEMVQQPLEETKFGTTFGASKKKIKEKQGLTASGIFDVMATEQTISSQPISSTVSSITSLASTKANSSGGSGPIGPVGEGGSY